MQLNLNLNALDGPIQQAWATGPGNVVQTMGLAFAKAITDPVYTWPRGQSPRDIVDTGALRDSQSVAITTAAAEYTWDAKSDEGYPYPIAVHQGYRDRGGNPMPARPWTQIAMQRTPPDQVMQRNLDRLIK